MSTVLISNKDIVRDLLMRLPEEVPLLQIASEIEFIAAVRQGMVELDRGDGITIEQMEKDLTTWIIQ